MAVLPAPRRAQELSGQSLRASALQLPSLSSICAYPCPSNTRSLEKLAVPGRTWQGAHVARTEVCDLHLQALDVNFGCASCVQGRFFLPSPCKSNYESCPSQSITFWSFVPTRPADQIAPRSGVEIEPLKTSSLLHLERNKRIEGSLQLAALELH